MSRLFRETRTENIQDRIASPERSAEIFRKYGSPECGDELHFPAYCQSSTDNSKKRTFIIFAGQGCVVEGRFGVVQQEIDREYVVVKFKDGNETCRRDTLERMPEDPKVETKLPERKWITETAVCPRCLKDTSRIFVDQDGDVYQSCSRPTCEPGSTTVRKSLERMAIEYPDTFWSKYKMSVKQLLEKYPKSDYWRAYAKKEAGETSLKEAA